MLIDSTLFLKTFVMMYSETVVFKCEITVSKFQVLRIYRRYKPIHFKLLASGPSRECFIHQWNKVTAVCMCVCVRLCV